MSAYERGVVIIPYARNGVELYVDESLHDSIRESDIPYIQGFCFLMGVPCTVRAVDDGDQGEINLVPAMLPPQYYDSGER